MVSNNKHMIAVYEIIPANESSVVSGVNKISIPRLLNMLWTDQKDIKEKVGHSEEVRTGNGKNTSVETDGMTMI